MSIEHVTPENARLLQQISDSIANCRRIVVVAGAGISTNCGIPDFRSEQGLYSLIQSDYGTQSRSQRCENVARRVTGKSLFDATLWSSELSTSVFYKFIAGLRSKVRELERTTPTHRFIKTLRDKKKLVRAYTQNIDGLEERAGLSSDMDRGVGSKTRFAKKWTTLPLTECQVLADIHIDGGCEVVELHGNLKVLRCNICQNKSRWDEEGREDSFRDGEAPLCPHCASKNQRRLDEGKRRLPIGTLRPNIVLYGEEHPAAEQISEFVENDISLVDVCLIFGTSLKVHGLKHVVKQLAAAAHSRKHGKGKVFFINNTPPPKSVWTGIIDAWIEMDCDAFVRDVRSRRPDIWETQAILWFKPTKITEAKKAKDAVWQQKKNEVVVEEDVDVGKKKFVDGLNGWGSLGSVQAGALGHESNNGKEVVAGRKHAPVHSRLGRTGKLGEREEDEKENMQRAGFAKGRGRGGKRRAALGTITGEQINGVVLEREQEGAASVLGDRGVKRKRDLTEDSETKVMKLMKVRVA